MMLDVGCLIVDQVSSIQYPETSNDAGCLILDAGFVLPVVGIGCPVFFLMYILLYDNFLTDNGIPISNTVEFDDHGYVPDVCFLNDSTFMDINGDFAVVLGRSFRFRMADSIALV